MRPLADWPLAARRHIVGVMTDIDDTLTTDGAITPDALRALADLRAAGLHVLAITGRSTGWSEPFATAWPVDAIVAENGAVLLQMSSQIGLQRLQDGREALSKTYLQDEATRRVNFARMRRVAERLRREVPAARLAEDSWGRETDMAVDHNECHTLPPEAIAQVVAIMRAEGMHATVSSIHINGWFGTHDKLEGARWAVRTLYGRNLDAELDRWVYVGDSSNDQLMFQTLPHAVGVANVRRFASSLQHLPRYITEAERGAGFAEVARAVLEAA
ncbi:HAD family hydrolase [Rhodoferax koreense]|uniref:HAD family hydrolase n=1 Tax=Rhodoferax koreensis TaxID=1842727 RepID=A0A1P8JT46_9BURK|nr:HAD-IIB family hydrolase [Rhodoferax koreense]APW36926.1 HAD family hydrolase [Rhodoferax koreense]